jgi:hypothetical protein
MRRSTETFEFLVANPAKRLERKIDYATEKGMFVDVSKLNADGIGARIIPFPKNNPNMMYVDGINLISDNFLGYERACHLLEDTAWYTDLVEKYTSEGDSDLRALDQLREFLESAEERDKIVDVSKMDEYGNGLRLVVRPGVNSNKIRVEELGLVSNNFETLERAIILLGNDPYLLDELDRNYFPEIATKH